MQRDNWAGDAGAAGHVYMNNIFRGRSIGDVQKNYDARCAPSGMKMSAWKGLQKVKNRRVEGNAVGSHIG